MCPPNPFGQVVDTSSSDGLTIGETWSMLFRQNEVAFESGLTQSVKDDPELAAAMQDRFPRRRWSKCLADVKRARAAYNRGYWTQQVPPIRQSYRYERIPGGVRRVTARGVPVTTVEGVSISIAMREELQ